MPIPVDPSPTTPGVVRKRGFHLPGRQPWARNNERRSHAEALYGFGEYCLFVLLWSLDDLKAERVERCSRCSTVAGDNALASEAIFEAFKQPAEDRCPNCYGTTMEGGWKAKIVRPALWVYGEEEDTSTSRGEVTTNRATVQSTADFFPRSGDFVFRADGTRWQLGGAQATRLIDGFGHPSRADNSLGVLQTSAVLENPSSVAYSIEPLTRTELTNLLDVVGRHFPPPYESLDQVRGPLIPEPNEYVPIDYRPLDHLPGDPEGQP